MPINYFTSWSEKFTILQWNRFEYNRRFCYRIVISDGPVLANSSFHNGTVMCFADGNPRPNTTWFIRIENTTVGNYSNLDVCDLNKTQQWMTLSHPSKDKLELDLICTASCNDRVTSKVTSLKLTYEELESFCEDDSRPTEQPACPDCSSNPSSM